MYASKHFETHWMRLLLIHNVRKEKKEGKNNKKYLEKNEENISFESYVEGER